jgi:ketosteroid isomerase-like protein
MFFKTDNAYIEQPKPNDMMKAAFCMILVAGLSTACSDKQISTAELESIVKKNNTRLGHYFMTANADSLALFYGADATLCPNGDDFVKGRDNIRQYWKEDMKTSKTLSMETETISIAGTAEVIYETGRTHLKIFYNDSTFNTSVKYCNVWRQQPDGTYRLEVDIWNRDKRE